MLALAATYSAAVQVEPKATEAVVGFSQLCVGMFTGGNSDVDPARFDVMKLDQDTVKQIKPSLPTGESLWDVSGKASGVRTLVHYEPTGMCVMEVAEASEAAIRVEYATLVQQTAQRTGAKVEPQPDRKNKIEGKDATTSMWKLTGGPENIIFTITTYPEAKFMIQHLMTVNYTN